MATSYSVRALSEADYPEWAQVVSTSPDGSVYATPEYLDVLCRATGGRFEILGVFTGDALAGGLALYSEQRWFGRAAGPRLLLYYHSPVVRHYDTTYPSQLTGRQVGILGALAESLRGRRWGQLILKCRPTVTDVRVFAQDGWRCTPSYTYVVPLDDLEAQWKRVEQNLRRLVNRAEGQGIVVTDDDDVPGFHQLHAATMRRKGGGLYLPAPAFGPYVRELRTLNLCRLYHARLPDGTAIAGQLVLLGPNPVSHTVMAVADEAHMKTGASAFLRWKVFHALAQLGFSGNDLTDAALNPVTHFKSQLGGRLELCHVLEAPQSSVRRAARALDTLGWRARGAAGALARRFGWRRVGDP